MSSILYIEDDEMLALTLKEKLQQRYAIETAFNGQEGFIKSLEKEFDLIIIDYFLPDRLGLEVCHDIRENDTNISILFLTQNTTKKDAIQALDAGADDYITKPFHFDELEARIRALLRRQSHEKTNLLDYGPLKLDQHTQQLFFNHEEIHLKRQEFLLLEFLMIHRGQTITRSQLYEHVWGQSYLESNTLDVHIKRIRQKIEKPYGEKFIYTVYGLGYKFNGKLAGKR